MKTWPLCFPLIKFFQNLLMFHSCLLFLSPFALLIFCFNSCKSVPAPFSVFSVSCLRFPFSMRNPFSPHNLYWNRQFRIVSITLSKSSSVIAVPEGKQSPRSNKSSATLPPNDSARICLFFYIILRLCVRHLFCSA
jgi:hypothetical protein